MNKVILLLGAPGSGKDTQAEVLQKQFGYLPISTGDLVRKAIAAETDIGRKIKQGNNTGGYAQTELMYELLESELRLHSQENVCLIGAVRELNQVSYLDKLLGKLQLQLIKVIFLDLPEEEIVRRISGRWYAPNGNVYHTSFRPPRFPGLDDETGAPLYQREDDKPEVVQHRIQIFRHTINPILETYAERGLLKVVSAVGSIEEVGKRVLKAV